MALEGRRFLLFYSGCSKSYNLLLSVGGGTLETSDLPTFGPLPPIRHVSRQIYCSPEISDDEFFSHNLLIN